MTIALPSFAALFLSVGALDVHAQALPSQAQLDAITARGRDLAAYDRAAWLATDAVLALSPQPGLVTHYIPRKTSSGWLVAFGRLSANADTFFIAFEAVAEGTPVQYRAQAFTQPRPDTGFLARAAKAINTSRADFGTPSRPYNVAVLPDSSGDWWVYLFPASTQAGVWPHGGDVRYRVAAEGSRIVEKRRLHNAIIDYALPFRPDSLAGAYHTAVLDDIVEDTDVFLVLARRPLVSELVVTKSFLFRIDIDGRITCTIRREEP